MINNKSDSENEAGLGVLGTPATLDSTEVMSGCFIEEFLSLGYKHEEVLTLFRNPRYPRMNVVLRERGEQFVRQMIAETYAIWGRPILWRN